MKKGKNVLLILFLGITLACAAPKAAQAAVNEDGSVTVNEENFPDERFRLVASAYDTNKDNVLSLSERSVLKELTLDFGYRDDVDYRGVETKNYPEPEKMDVVWKRGGDDPETISVKGIEYFPELHSYGVTEYARMEGSLKNNAKLEEISLSVSYDGFDHWESTCEDCSRLQQDFPMNQLKIIRSGDGFECKNFSLRGATELQELYIGFCGCYCIANPSKLGEVDLSANKKLKKLYLQGVEVKTLDLRKNTNLQEIMIGGNRYLYDYKKGKGMQYTKEGLPYYHVGKRVGKMYMVSGTKCNLKIPKNNSIKKFIYMTLDKKLDLTSCKKLAYLQINAGVQVKFSGKWYNSYGKKKLVLYTRGTKVKKKIQKKSKKYVYIKTKEFKNYERDPDQPWFLQPCSHG